MAAVVPKHFHCGGLGRGWGHHGQHGCLLKKIAIVVAVGVTYHVGSRLIQAYCRNKRQKKYKRDTVILHVFPRATTVPSMSPYCLKLETYLRLSKLPYEVDMVDPGGPNRKAPWISYNDEAIPDSDLCIDYLNKTFNVNLNEKLNASQQAIAHALQVMTDEHFVWCFALQRYAYDPNRSYLKLMDWSKWIPYKVFAMIIRRVVVKRANVQGIGLHPQEVVLDFAKKDLKALSDYLGDKKFFFGSDITEVDCALFGMLSMVVWTNPGSPLDDWINGEFLNLKQYCYRIKEQVWPDWEDHLLKRNA